MLNVLDNAMMMALTSDGGAGTAATFDLDGILSSAVSTVQSSIFTTLGVVVPAIVSVLAAVVCVKFGMRWIKKMGQG